MSSKKKTKPKIGFVEHMLQMKRAGLSHRSAGLVQRADPDLLLEPLEKRIAKILEINQRDHLNPEDMLFFIMYDIENNKVRNRIAKYLLKKGCLRVQKSIFFAEAARAIFDNIHSDLKAIQEMYDNNDSIFFVPISADQMRSMRIVGQSIDFDLIAGNKTTLFF